MSKGIKHHLRCAKRFTQFLRRNPQYALRYSSWIPYLTRWWNTLDTDTPSTPVGDPWLPFLAVDWLKETLSPSSCVFEYGSGASTLFLAQRAARVVSIEHDSHWHELLSSNLTEQHISNCDYLLVEPEYSEAKNTDAYSSQHRPKLYSHANFKNYVQTIDTYPDQMFDMILIDGRARSACIKHSIPKVRPGGYLLLDDSGRKRYGAALSLLSRFERIDFYGIKPRTRDPSHASVWKIL